MAWILEITNLAGQLVLEPENFSDGYLVYRKAYEITEDRFRLKDFIPADAENAAHCFNLSVYIVLEKEGPVLFMEKRGFVCHDDAGVSIEWRERPEHELPYRVIIRPDDMSYAWDEYDGFWSVNWAYPDDPVAEQLHKDFKAWHWIFESIEIGDYGRPIITFSWQEYNQTGLALAKRLKMLGKDNIVVFYERPYEEVSIVESIQLVKLDE